MNSLFTSPFGRPKWLNKISFAPWSNAYLIVGSAAVILVSSETFPSLIGTLKSTLIKTFLPSNFKSFIDNLFIKH